MIIPNIWKNKQCSKPPTNIPIGANESHPLSQNTIYLVPPIRSFDMGVSPYWGTIDFALMTILGSLIQGRKLPQSGARPRSPQLDV